MEIQPRQFSPEEDIARNSTFSNVGLSSWNYEADNHTLPFWSCNLSLFRLYSEIPMYGWECWKRCKKLIFIISMLVCIDYYFLHFSCLQLWLTTCSLYVAVEQMFCHVQACSAVSAKKLWTRSGLDGCGKRRADVAPRPALEHACAESHLH